jgi:hypothetical protein
MEPAKARALSDAANRDAAACKPQRARHGRRSSDIAADMQCHAAGFSYIGLLILVAATSIALSVTSEMWVTVQKREKEEELLFIGDQFRRAFALYGANAAGNPRQLEDLLKDPRLPDTRRYLRKLFRDPITGRPEWGLLKSTGDTIIGVYSLSEDEPIKNAEFRLVDQSFEGKKKYSEWVFFQRTSRSAGAPSKAPAAGAMPSGSAVQTGIPQTQPDGTPSVTGISSTPLQTTTQLPMQPQVQTQTHTQTQTIAPQPAPGVMQPAVRQ